MGLDVGISDSTRFFLHKQESVLFTIGFWKDAAFCQQWVDWSNESLISGDDEKQALVGLFSGDNGEIKVIN
jgi:hypothetical protein